MLTDAKPADIRSSARRRALQIAVIIGLVAYQVAALADGTMAAATRHPLEPVDTSSPRGTLIGFLEACDDAYQLVRQVGRGRVSQAERTAIGGRIVRCLDLSDLPPALRNDLAAEAAVYLKEVLDRIELPAIDEIPDRDQVAARGLTRWQVPHTDVWIARLNEGPRQGQFVFTRDTVDQVDEYFELVKDLPYQEREHTTRGLHEWYLSDPGWMIPRSLIHSLPSWARYRLASQAVWQWVGLVVALVVGLLVMLAIYRIGRWRAGVAGRSNVLRFLLTLAFPIAAMLVPLAVESFVTRQLSISGNVRIATSFSLNLVFLMAVVIVLIASGTRLAELIIATPLIQPTGLDAQLVRLGCRVTSIVAAAVVVLEGGRQLGIPLTTLLAGAGVGGLALALAAQDTLKNVFGSIMIILDKPYKVGERIVVKGYDGFVEEIGLRSTKLRLLTGHQAFIPNEEMARSDVENVGRRPHIRRVVKIPIPLYTSREKLEQAVAIVRQALENHEGMDPNYPPRVGLYEIHPDGFKLLVIYWYTPPNYWEFLAFSEKLNLTICRAFEEQGIKFSLPLRITYTDSDGSPRPPEPTSHGD